MSSGTKKVKTGENPFESEVGSGEIAGGGGGSGAQRHEVASSFGEDEEIVYLGEYWHGTDKKGRCQVPSRWRPANWDNYELTAVPWTRSTEAQACLLVFPPSEMKKLLRSVKQMSWGDPEAETLRRALGGKSESLKIDRAGRICLSDRIAKYADIKKNSEVVMVGMMDVFQLWSPERFKSINSADGLTLPQALGRLKKDDNKPQ